MERFWLVPLVLMSQIDASISLAEPLSTYVEECKAALNIDRIPGYSCSDGYYLPSADGFEIATTNNYVGRVDTGYGHVDAVFLCRGVDHATDTADLNGYILQNRDNGYICFFDARNGTSATDLPDLDSPTASSYWEDPAGMDGACEQCHSNDPFIVSRPLAFPFRELRLLYGDRPYLGPYRITSTSDPTSHFYEWEADAKSLWQSSSCADNCHRLSNNQRILNISSDLLTEGLMPPLPGTIYDDVPPSYVVMASVW